MSSCTEKGFEFWHDEPNANKINVGGIGADDMAVSVTRSTSMDAEKVTWLLQPLKNGLDITYGLYGAVDNHQDVAILTLSDKNHSVTPPYDTENDLAVYTFKYRADRTAEVGDGNDAIWYNNGYHYFQGVHVPSRLRYTEYISEVNVSAPNLMTEQFNDTETGTDEQLGNYTLLSHYLGMPANFRLTATVERIKLPFRHRLARVVAFVLIDPELHTTLRGYKTDKKKDDEGNEVYYENPVTTKFRFSKVKVLEGVKDVEGAGGHHELTPKWNTARKIVPHYDGEKGSYSYKTLTELDPDSVFKFYYKEDDGKRTELYPTSANWASVHNNAGHNGYTEVNYGRVPVYDIIVQPTYTTVDSVMYDEENYETNKTALANQTNSIDFEIELENGLMYEKNFEFDLNANYQTVVYLRISREHVDYNASGSELWREEKDVRDDWYGVDNENGNTLSFAGSSWQRAYRTMKLPDTDRVTDGDLYDNGEDVGQYLNSNDKWTRLLLQAYKGGDHHGDYFVLDNNITIDAKSIPKDFVFTGHLDAQDHTITLTGVGEAVYKDAETLEGLFTESDGNYSEWTIPTLYVKHVTPATYWQESELTQVGGVWYVTSSITWVSVQYEYYTQGECDEENNKTEHHPKKVDSGGRSPGDDGYVDTWDMERYVDGYEPWTTEKVKSTTPAHCDLSSGVQHNPGEEKTPEIITYPQATAETSPAYPTTLAALRENEYYTNQTGTPFVCPDLYQFSHTSPAYLFHGLDGTYTTAQEADLSVKVWEANVHKETNQSTVWVPTLGYRAEVLNAVMASPATLFRGDATVTGNVQNCYNGSEKIPNHTPAIPQYK